MQINNIEKIRGIYKNKISDNMTSYKIVVEREKCTSCGNCQDECSEIFKLDEDGICHLKESERINDNDELETEDLGCALDSARGCPVACIHIFEDGEEIT